VPAGRGAAVGARKEFQMNAEIKDEIISETTSGSADDGNDNNNPKTGMTYPPGRKAKGNTTTADSDDPKYDKVGGNVKVIPAPPQGATKDAARATSNSQVNSKLVVTKADKVTFNIHLEVIQPKVTKNAYLTVRVRANVLDKHGVTMKNSQITDTELKIDLDNNGKPQVTPVDPSSGQPLDTPEPLDANGDYKRRLSGPGGGIDLAKDDYQVELGLQIVGSASTSPGGDLATIEHATAKIEVR